MQLNTRILMRMMMTGTPLGETDGILRISA